MKPMQELLYGAAYYYEYLPYPEPERKQKRQEDLELMKQAGMNVIRIAESTWSTYEKKEGEYDFSPMTETIEAAAALGMKVIVGTCTYAIPAWLARKHPEIMLVNSQGASKYGHRQSFNLAEPAYLEYCRKIIARQMEAAAPYENVIGFQIDNETHHQGVFNENVQQAFVQKLKEEYQNDFDRFNLDFGLDYWSNRIDDWEDFPDLSGCINASLLSAYEDFRRTILWDFFSMQKEIIDQYRRPDQFVTHNFDFGWKDFSFGIHPEVDQFKLAELLDIVGCDIYHPSRARLTGAEISFCGQLMYSLKNTNYLVLETQSQGEEEKMPLPGQLRLCACAHLANGANMVEYWPWSSIHTSKESYMKGILSHTRVPGRVYEEACTIGADFHRLSPELINLKRTPKVALVINKTSQFGLGSFDWQKPERSYNAWNDAVRLMADSLYRQNVEFAVVEERDLAAQMDQYALLIFPALYSTQDDTPDLVRQALSQGVSVLATFRSFQADALNKIHSEVMPYHLDDVFGLQVAGSFVPSAEEEYDQLEDQALMEEVNLKEAELVWACKNEPLLCVRAHEKASAWYLTAAPRPRILDRLMHEILEQTDIAHPEYLWPVVVKEGLNQQGKKITYYMNFSEQEAVVRPARLCRELTENEEIAGGESLRLKAWDVRITEEESAGN